MIHLHRTVARSRVLAALVRTVVLCLLLAMAFSAIATPNLALAASAVRALSGTTLGTCDDCSAPVANLGFTINYFGTNYSQAYVNSNGNITFGSGFTGFNASGMAASVNPMIAPLWYDVDTNRGGTITYGTATVGGRNAFFGTWNAVGYFGGSGLPNTFQALIVDRSDTGVGNFDIEYNYNSVLRDPGSAGYADGSAGSNDFQFAGSLTAGALLDSNPTTGLANYSTNSPTLGRHSLAVRGGAPFVPQLSSPADSANNVARPTTLTWQTLASATSYRVIVSTQSNLSSPLIDQSGITGTSYVANGLSISTRYYWQVIATDGTINAQSNIWSFTTAGNTPPTISDIPDQSTNEDTATGPINFTVGDFDTAAGSLTVSGSSSNTTLVPNANIVFGGSGANRTVTVTPAANQNGTATITVNVSDGGLTTSDTFVLTITPVNDAPVANPGSLTTPEDTAASGMLSATDVDGDALTYNIVTNGTKGVAVITNASTGAFSYTPNADFNGSDSFTFRANDGITDSNVATVTITITPVNDPPVAADDSGPNFATNEDTVLASSNVPANIIADVPEAATYQLVYALTNIPANADYDGALPPYSTNNAANVGTFSRVAYYLELDNGSGRRWVYVSMDAFTTDPLRIGVPVGSIAFQQKVTNMNVASNASGVTTGTNIATGNIEFWSNCYDKVLGLGTIGGSSSAYDFNDTRTIASPSCYGSMQVHNYGTSQTILAYNAWDENGADEIGIGNAPSSDIDWTFARNAGTYTVRNLYVLASGVPSVLQNDSDADNDPLTVSAFDATSAQGATVTMQPNGSFTYDPRPSASLNALDTGENVVDTFTYTATDGIASDSATVSIIVNGVNDAPVASNGSLTTNEDTTANGTLVASDVDVEPLTYSIVTNGTKGVATITDASTGAFTYTPNANANGSDNFTFRANDGTADSNVATVTITITPVNDAPVNSGPGAGISSFTNAATITIPDSGAASPYPSTITIAGASTSVNNLTVTLTNINHTFPDDLDILLVGPAGKSVLLMSDAGSSADLVNQTLTFDDAAAATLPDSTQIASGSYRPSNYGSGDTFAAPAPAPPYGSTLAVFNGSNPNGDWKLYVVDDASSDSGNIAGGWTLNINSGVTTNEDTPVTLGAASVLVSVSDVDAGSNPLLVTLATSDGTLTLNGTAGLSGSGSGSGSLSYSGTLADLNTALDGMIFTPAPDFNGVASVYMTSDDQGATGGPAQTDSDTYFITVTSVNDAPSFTAGANQTVAEDAGPQIVSGWATSISAGPADESGQTISFLVTYDNAALFSGVPTIAPDGTLTYTPAPDAFGSATVTVQAQDDGGTANGGSDTSPVQTFTITITPVNDAPVATDDSYSVLEDGSITSSAATGVLANDSDVDGDPLTAILVSTTSNGTLTLNPDGSFAYTPNGDFNGSDSFTYTANDGTTDSNVTTVTITVASVNDAPVAVDDSASTPEDTPLTVAAPGVLANDTDVDGDPMTATLVSTTSNGTLTLNADGSFSYTPNADFTGTDSFTYKANDGTTDSNIAMVTITVAAVNDAPVATDNSYTTDEDTPLTVTAPGVLANDSDVDGDPLTAILVSTTSNGTLTLNADGSFSYTPNADFNGSDSFTYTANDGTTDSNVATVTITITAVNDAPVNSVPGAQTANEDTDLIFSPGNGNAMSISDLDAGSGAVQVTLSAGNGTLTLAGSTGLSFTVGDGTNDATLTFTGTIADSNAALDGLRYTPSAGYNGSDTLSITTDDQGNTGTGGALSDSDSVAISVAAINDAPSFTSGANEIVAEDAGPQTVSGWATNISPGPADESGQTISFGVTNDNPALFSVDPTIAPDGTLTYTPAPDAFGSATVTVQAQDNGGTANGGNDTSPAQTFTITVTPVNDPPVASDDTLITDEDTAASGTLVATDVDDNALTYSIVANGTQGSVTITDASTGAFTYTPDPDANGSDSFTYTANDGTDDSNVATVTITVTSVNDAPSFTTGANEIVAEDAGAQTVSGWATSISPGPADEITQTVSFSVTNDNPALFSVAPVIASDGTLTYTPAPDASGSATITAQAQDDGGTANGGSDTSPAQTFTITITAVNDAPVTTDDSYTAAEDSTLTVAAASGVLQNDSDVDGDPLTATVVSSTSNGTLTLSTDGSFSYTPDPDYTGTDSFMYTANDGNGGTATATVTITITLLGDAPVASDSSLTTAEDTAASGTLIAIDADGDPLTYSIVANGTQGSVTITDPSTGAFTYTPDADANGSDSFTFQVNDGINDSNVATVTITITPVNDAPVASDGTLTTAENTAASGTLQATDVDGDALTYAIVANGTQGSVTITNASSGTFTYTPNPGVSGNDSFTFQVNDGTLDSNVATVTITITPSAVVPPTDTATRLYLPLLQRAPALPELPDLVVESIRVQDGVLEVVIANQGGRAVTQPFWVDAYLNPTSAPTAVNQTWPLLGDRGIAWGLRGDMLPLAPGARVTLTVGDSAYVAAKSNPGGTLAAGSTVYVQVDSASIGSPYGAVNEADEQDGGTYNNIAKLVVETDVVLPASAPATTQAAPPSQLPLRPE